MSHCESAMSPRSLLAFGELYRMGGVTPEGKIIGHFEATGVRPMFTDRLRVSGIELPARMFEGVD